MNNSTLSILTQQSVILFTHLTRRFPIPFKLFYIALVQFCQQCCVLNRISEIGNFLLFDVIDVVLVSLLILIIAIFDFEQVNTGDAEGWFKFPHTVLLSPDI